MAKSLSTATPSSKATAPITRLIIAIVLLGILSIGGLLFWEESQHGIMDFGQRQKVTTTSSLHFSFPALMDHVSVEQSMSIPHGMTGSWSWNDDILIFQPSEKLVNGETYTFHLSPTALQSDGSALGRSLDFTFEVAGPAKVAARLPNPNAVGIPPQSKITIVFDRPIIPLTQVQGDAASTRMANWPVTITPSVQGRWRWLSTIAVEFIPTIGLVPSTKYTVHVPDGITTVAGDATEQDFSWSFETIRPTMIDSSPLEGYQLAGPTTVLSLTFNQEMNLQTAKPQLKLTARSIADPPTIDDAKAIAPAPEAPMQDIAIASLLFGTKELKDGKKVEDRTTIIVIPSKPLQFQTAYTLSIGSDLKAAQGDLPIGSGSSLSFQTVGALSVSGWLDTMNGSIKVNFSNPVESGSLKKAITISPTVKAWEETVFDPQPWTDNRTVEVSPALAPSTEYSVTVGTAATDIFGQHLKEPFIFTFKTAPLAPSVSIDSKGTFGIFERGKPPIYYLSAVNVSRLDVAFAALSIDEFLSSHLSLRYSSESGLTDLQGRKDYQQWSIPVQAKENEGVIEPFDVEKKLGRTLPPGIYALTVRAPEFRNDYNKKPAILPQYFALTNIGLTLKHSGDHALVWATDLRTGEPVKGAAISFHSLTGKSVLTGSTDAQGFFETAIDLKAFESFRAESEPEIWVTATKGDDMAFVSNQWNDGIRPWNFDSVGMMDFRYTTAGSQRVFGHLYTERPLYRVGDSVNFKGIVRMLTWDGTFELPDQNRSVNVRVQDPNGNEIYNKSLPFSTFGSFSDTFPIDAQAALGDYFLSATVTPDADISNSFMNTMFSVLAYRKPEYKVELTTAQSEYFNGDTIRADIAGSYYFGAPMSSAHVSWRAQTTDYFFNRFTDGWYSFALEDSWCWWECMRTTENVASGEGTLDATGLLTVSIPVNLDTKGVSQVYTIEADITDENNQVVSNRISVPVHKADLYVGVRTDDYVVTPGKAANISIVTVKPDGTVLPNRSVTLQVFERKWNTIRKKGVDGEYYYDSTPQDTFLKELSAKTENNGKTTVPVIIDAGGSFRIVASASDDSGRESKAGTSVFAWSDTYVNWPRSNNDRIDILPDKPEYSVGDTAKLLIKSPFQGKGVKALVTVERENILTKKVIDIESAAQSIEVPITADLLPTAYVSVVIVKPRIGETFDENGLDTGVPAFKIGYARLNIETKSKALSIAVSTDKEQYLPGEQVVVTLTATDSKGAPARAELSLGAVDMSVLDLTGFEMPRLVEVFYGRRGLGVVTSQMLTRLLERFKPGSKGGGGDDLEMRKRGNFKDTAYWNPIIDTNEKGQATVTFTLPDNLTTWHLLAIGHTKDHLFGAAARTILETKSVIVRPVRPRFAVVGDAVTIGAIVHNFLPQTQSFTVSLTGSGFSADGGASKNITIAPKQQGKILFPVHIDRTNKAVFIFRAEGDGARDEVEESIPVYVFGTPQTVATTSVTESIAEEKVIAPSAKDASDGSLSVTISPSMATYLPSGLDYLLQYPYGCAEQTMSSFLPSVALSTLQGFDAFRIVDSKKLDDIVTAGLERLYMFQRADGGFGYWQESTESFPTLSSYILFGMQTAEHAGFSVDANVMGRTREYLTAVLHHPVSHLSLAARADILFTLADGGKIDMSLLSNLYDQRKDLPVFAHAQLALAYQIAGSSKSTTLLHEIENAAKVDSRGTHFEEAEERAYWMFMNTNDRTTALVLSALVRIEPDNVLIPNVVRYMLNSRKDGHWDTTQSTVYSLLALTDFLKETKELDASYAAGIEVNGTKILDWTVGKENILSQKEASVPLADLNRGAENSVKVGKEGKGRLYYDLLLKYFYTADDLPPAEEGISILREMAPAPGSKESVTVGGTYVVTLTITVPEDRNFVAVESPLPAGLEAIDVSLKTSQQNLLGSLAENDSWSPDYWENGLWRFNHREFRDDSVFLFADSLPAGVYQYHYLARATTPGTYHLRPARAFEMYFPETFGQTAGELVTVKE
ncbi:MAG: Ig-like domain-containing protein [Candidatus Peribacteraceae bacterium]|nr:Ig-like domain-containing protein [Candidatus Peribacteraceae bacterium]